MEGAGCCAAAPFVLVLGGALAVIVIAAVDPFAVGGVPAAVDAAAFGFGEASFARKVPV